MAPSYDKIVPNIKCQDAGELMKKTLNKRKLQAKETKQKLLKTSMDLVNKHGYDNVTVDDICKASNVSKGTFYHHFKSKSDVIGYVDDSFKEAFIQDALYDKDTSIETKLTICINGALDWVEKSGFELTRQRTVFMVNGYNSHTNWEDSFTEFVVSIIKRLILEAIENEELKKSTPVEVLAELISIFITGLIANWTIYEGNYSLTEKSTQLSLPMIKGLIREYRQ